MALIKRQSLQPLILPTEEVEVEALGGSVVVRGMSYSARVMFLEAAHVALGVKSEDKAISTMRLKTMAPAALADNVFDADDQPLMDADAWDVFGRLHGAAVDTLFATLLRLSGFDVEEARKN